MVSEVDRPRLLQGRSRAPGQSFLRRHSAAQRHRPAPSRPRAQRLVAGHNRPHAADAGLQHAVVAGDRPCRHRDAERRRERPRQGRQGPSHDGPRRVRQSRLGMARDLRQPNPEPAAPPRRVMRLEPRALHPRRGPVAGRDESLCRSLQQEAHLPRQAAHQLVPAMRDGAVRPRSRSQGRRAGQPLVHPLPVHRRHRRDHDRDDAAGDDAR